MRLLRDAPNDTSALRGVRLDLTFGSADDVAELYRFVAKDGPGDVTDFLCWDGADGPEELAGYFDGHATATFADGGYHYLLRDRTGELSGSRGRALGSIGIRPGSQSSAGDLGYWLAPPYWGRGLMREAIALLVGHAFDHWGFDAVEADVFAHNERGLALLDGLGFDRVKTMPDYVEKRGRLVDGVRFRVTREAWATSPGRP